MPKQVYIYGDSLLKATMPDEGYHYHFHYDEVLQRYPERRIALQIGRAHV